MASEPGKRPSKGILKHTSSLDKASKREVEWDEMNILATHHPPDKDYGHMKIDEPPTPYNKYSDAEDDEEGVGRRGSAGSLKEPAFDATQLVSRLAATDEKGEKSAHLEESSEEDENETEEERMKRKQFELKRKLHYNEFAAVQLAKKLMSEEEDDDDDDNDNAAGPVSTATGDGGACEAMAGAGSFPSGQVVGSSTVDEEDNDVTMRQKGKKRSEGLTNSRNKPEANKSDNKGNKCSLC